MYLRKLIAATAILVVLPFVLSTGFLFYFATSQPDMPALPTGPYPGDNVVSDAVMIYDQSRLVHAPPADVWPWVLQVGKGRGGWYSPASWEKFLPQGWHATRTINPIWENLKPGDRVDDYGFSADDYFIVSDVQPKQALIFRSDRYGAFFSWALILHEVSEGDTVKTLLHLRFRGKIAATGLKKKLLVTGGGIMDHITPSPMLAGLAERAEHSKRQ